MINKLWLRGKGIIGGLKSLSSVFLVIAILQTLVGARILSAASKNRNGPQEVSITELVNGEIATDSYVSVSGYISNQASHGWAGFGVNITSYYYLADLNSGDIIPIKYYSAYTNTKKAGNTTIIGMVEDLDPGISEMVRENEVSIKKMGLRTNDTVCVAAEEAPPSIGASLTQLLAGIVIAVIGIAPLFFPSSVFVPCALDSNHSPQDTRPKIKASGQFQKLISFKPFKIDPRTQKFNHMAANFITNDDENSIIIIIQHTNYSILTNRQKNIWGIYLNTTKVQKIEPGKIYSWKNQWAMRIQYLGPHNKNRRLHIIFENVKDLASFAKLLQDKQFQISMPPLNERPQPCANQPPLL